MKNRTTFALLFNSSDIRKPKDQSQPPELRKSVILIEIKSFKVYMLGNIKQAGVIELGQETRLLQVLSQAKGFTEFANTKRILVLREEATGTRRYVINYDRIVSGEDLESNIKLLPGDTVVVP